MDIEVHLILLLMSHVFGDFYLQTEKAFSKEYTTDFIFHCVLYFIGVAFICFICVADWHKAIFLALQCGTLHFLIEYMLRNRDDLTNEWIDNHLFIVDQFLQCVCLVIVWQINHNTIILRNFVTLKVSYLSTLPITLLLGWLCILKPANKLITFSKTWQDYKNGIVNSNSGAENAGRIIGYLERTIVYILLMYKQFSAIAFILTAKSVARFKEIENNQTHAEYYLIGTLMSVAVTLLIAVMLGICGSPSN